MTIAISLKVHNGVVLATDSAASITAQSPDGQALGIVNVYQNAEKLFHLCKTKPIGIITWGTGSISQYSISHIIKDYRKQLTEQLGNEKFLIPEIAKSFSEFIKKLYDDSYKNWVGIKPSIGFLLAGYSDENEFAEEWMFEIKNGNLSTPILMRESNFCGMTWNGEPEAISRMLLGTSPQLPKVLKEAGLEDDMIERIISLAQERLTVPFIIDAMPIKDAIDLAHFFVETAINFSKYSPGAQTIGGPIDIAAITKHEGFKWVSRKYYYNSEIN